MLKYSLSALNFEGDIVDIDFYNIVLSNYGYSYGNTMLVTFKCREKPKVRVGDYLKVVSNVPYYNDIREEDTYFTEVKFHKIITVDTYAKTITIAVPKYQELTVSNSYLKDEDDDEYWYFDIEGSHLYKSDETGKFYIVYSETDYLYIDNAEIVDCETFRWKYDKDVENAYACKQIIFPDWANNTQFGRDTSNTQNGLIKKVTVSRPQVKWDWYLDSGTGLNIYGSIYKVSITVPISLDTDVRLHSEGNIREYFIDDEKENAINKVTEMEKRQYVPVVRKNDTFNAVSQINFNLHFREHSGDEWTVENEDNWNFSKFGYNTQNDPYYSYSHKDNQADLLTYAMYTNADVKYQKNVLKKSFLRLMFYDSMNPGNQNLLGYSTVFFDSGKLYSKYLKNCNLDAYYTLANEEAEGIRVDREVDVARLTQLLGHTPDDDEIEEYRLSCRFTVKNSYTTTNSSEGFYLYLWADNDNENVPDTIYMKVDFNHAGYGRTIPMMAPYWDQTIDGKNGFKTNAEIKSDWENGGYGIKKYMRYSYIRWKYMYDKTNNQHVYYLSPDHYGNNFDNVININLYEARVTYE